MSTWKDILAVVAFTVCVTVNIGSVWIVDDLTKSLREERARVWQMVEMVGNSTQAVSESNQLMLKMAEYSGLKVEVAP